MSPAPYYFYRFKDPTEVEPFDPGLKIVGALQKEYDLRCVDAESGIYEYPRKGRVLVLKWLENEVSIGGRDMPPEQWAVEFLYDVLIRTQTVLMCPDAPEWCTATESQIAKAPNEIVEIIENLDQLLIWFGVWPESGQS